MADVDLQTRRGNRSASARFEEFDEHRSAPQPWLPTVGGGQIRRGDAGAEQLNVIRRKRKVIVNCDPIPGHDGALEGVTVNVDDPGHHQGVADIICRDRIASGAGNHSGDSNLVPLHNTTDEIIRRVGQNASSKCRHEAIVRRSGKPNTNCG